jgi:3,4-dihydroxy 2-butanone 4-phosphate synthase/GTP cyclohydrolase II
MINDTIERIRAHLKSPSITKKALAEAAGLHPNTLQGIEEPGWNPSAATLIALEGQIPAPEARAA